MKGMKTCKICGRDFPLIFEGRYTVQDPQKIGAMFSLIDSDKAYLYDAIDCPHCGCQNILQPRKPVASEEEEQEGCPCDYGICDECDIEGRKEENDE